MIKNLSNILKVAISGLAIFSLLLPSAALAVDVNVLQQLQTPFYDPTSSSGCSVSSVSGDPVTRFIQVLARKESGTEDGSPTAQNPNSTASGRYQYLDTTWAGQTVYPPAANQYARAKDAPVEVQDAVAYLQYSKLYYQFQTQFTTSDVDKLVFYMALAHYGGLGIVNDQSQWDIIPGGGNTLSYREYANQAVEGYNDPSYANKVVLHYTAAPDFTMWYSKAIGHAYSGGLSSGTCSGSPAGSFVFYDQNDSKWANHPIYTGNLCGKPAVADTISCAGCGPTAAAMVVATLANSNVTPIDTGDYMTGLGSGVGYVDAGATASGIEQTLEHWGLTTQAISGGFDQVAQILRSGGLVIMGGIGNRPFSEGGHVVVLRAVDSSGNFLIGNPAPGLQDSQDQTFSVLDLQKSKTTFMVGVTQ